MLAFVNDQRASVRDATPNLKAGYKKTLPDTLQGGRSTDKDRHHPGRALLPTMYPARAQRSTGGSRHQIRLEQKDVREKANPGCQHGKRVSGTNVDEDAEYGSCLVGASP